MGGPEVFFDPPDEGAAPVRPRDMPPNASDPDAAPKGRRRAAKREQELGAFWRGILSSDTGRREIYALLREAGAWETTFAVGPNGFPQPEASWFYAGRRDFAQRVFLTAQRYAYDETALMLWENDPRFAVATRKVMVEADDDAA